jgi:hypothetical protein
MLDVYTRFRMLRTLCVLLLLAGVTACAEPPHKEMNQAQGAIDAARAAGAEQYGPQELAAAVDLLARSEQAVANRDYRLALSLAIDSRQRAQDAARAAVNSRARARGNAERTVAELNMLLIQVKGRFEQPAVTKLPRRVLDQARQTLAAAEKAMQEAGAALEGDEYARAMQLSEGASERLQDALRQIDAAAGMSAARKRE